MSVNHITEMKLILDREEMHDKNTNFKSESIGEVASISCPA